MDRGVRLRPAAPIWPPICTGETYDHGPGCSWPLSPCLERTLDKCDDLPLPMAALQLEGTSLQAHRYSAASRGRCVRAYPWRRRAQAPRNRNRRHRTEIGVIDVTADSDDHEYTPRTSSGPSVWFARFAWFASWFAWFARSEHHRICHRLRHLRQHPARKPGHLKPGPTSGSGRHGHVPGPDHGRRRSLDHQRPRHSRLAPGNQVLHPELASLFHR